MNSDSDYAVRGPGPGGELSGVVGVSRQGDAAKKQRNGQAGRKRRRRRRPPIEPPDESLDEQDQTPRDEEHTVDYLA